MDFNIAYYGVMEIFGIEIWLTETMRNMWIVMAFMLAIAVIIRIKLDTTTNKPTGLQNIIELIVEKFDRFVRTSAGDQMAYLGHWFFTVFFLLIFSNLSGLVMRPPTADWAFTFALAIATFLLIQILGYMYQPKENFKALFAPIFLFLPLNLIGEFSKPISLSFRLFGNVLSGMILIGLVYGLAPAPARLLIPVPLHAYFDVAMGLLQALVFTVLSLSFIGLSAGTSSGD